MTFRISFIVLILGALNCRAQQFVSVMDQLFTVHSSGNVFVNNNSSSRNIIEVHLPAKTVGYVYRVSAKAKNSLTGQNAQLFDLLKTIAPKQIVMEAALTQFAVQQTDGEAIDVFAFNTADDANIFLRKQDNFLRPCWYNLGVINTCFAKNTCLSPTIYFGFRNNNLATGINVHLEVVAVIDTSAKIEYRYSISNGVNQNLYYLLSNDQVNWERHLVATGYTDNLSSGQSKLYIRLITSVTSMVTYEILPEQRYRIVWNIIAKRLELATN